MKKKKLISIIIIAVLFCIVLNSIVISQLQNKYTRDNYYIIADIIGKIKENYPDIDESEIIEILNKSEDSVKQGQELLKKYGFNEQISVTDTLEKYQTTIIIVNTLSLIIFCILTIIIIDQYIKNKNKEIKSIIKYLEEINNRNYNLKIEENKDDELSNLKNELYKMTIMLKEQAETSLNNQKALQTSLEDISHQLKTPLTSICIMLDNIQENPDMDNQTRQTFIHEIIKQTEWINWLIISLLKMSKLDANTVQFAKDTINVEELINEVVSKLSIPIDIKQLKIIIKGNNAQFIGDYNWQLEAITNVVKNCIEHTDEHKNIYINYEENNFYTKIIIRDEGCGICKKDLKHIFERFYKGKNSSENSVGIGLALAKTIIEKGGGYITCQSIENKGTTFEIKYLKQ